MVRSSVASLPVLPAALLAGILGLGAVLMAKAPPAAAYDDDVDVVCFEVGSEGDTECQTIDQLTTECELADPEYTTDVCQGLLHNRQPLGLTTQSKNRRDERGDKDRGRDSGNGGNRGDGGRGGSDGGGSGPTG